MLRPWEWWTCQEVGEQVYSTWGPCFRSFFWIFFKPTWMFVATRTSLMNSKRHGTGLWGACHASIGGKLRTSNLKRRLRHHRILCRWHGCSVKRSKESTRRRKATFCSFLRDIHRYILLRMNWYNSSQWFFEINLWLKRHSSSLWIVGKLPSVYVSISLISTFSSVSNFQDATWNCTNRNNRMHGKEYSPLFSLALTT